MFTADGELIIEGGTQTVYVFCKLHGAYRSGESKQWWRMRVDDIQHGDTVCGLVERSHVAGFPASECFNVKPTENLHVAT